MFSNQLAHDHCNLWVRAQNAFEKKIHDHWKVAFYDWIEATLTTTKNSNHEIDWLWCKKPN